jgi:hypothetical protein
VEVNADRKLKFKLKLGSGLDIDIRVFDPHEDSLRRKPKDLTVLSYFA